jgi:hypothetical protein
MQVLINNYFFRAQMQREREETRDIVNSETKMIQVLYWKNESKMKKQNDNDNNY